MRLKTLHTVRQTLDNVFIFYDKLETVAEK